jgi:uncharacterized membrane protein
MGSRWGTSRTEAFSDGVFAIAITLLVLDLSVPADSFDHLTDAILDQWPSYLAYVTSFLTIGGIWLAHHGIFGRLRYVSPRIMRINLLLLMATSFLPFPTRLVAEAIRTTSAERTAVIFYGLALLVISILVALLWRSVVTNPDLLRPEVTEAEIAEITAAARPNLAFYLAFMALAILTPHVAAFGYLVVALQLVWRARGDTGSQPAR